MKEPAFRLHPYWKKISFSILFLLFISFSACIYLYSHGYENPVPEMNSTAEKGKLLWNKNNCSACHQFYGLGGYLGPDLTNYMSRPGKGAIYAAAILKEGIGIMPAFHMTENEIHSIVEFLVYTNSTGDFPGNGKPKIPRSSNNTEKIK